MCQRGKQEIRYVTWGLVGHRTVFLFTMTERQKCQNVLKTEASCELILTRSLSGNTVLPVEERKAGRPRRALIQ